jgi:hypothetical protein
MAVLPLFFTVTDVVSTTSTAAVIQRRFRS